MTSETTLEQVELLFGQALLRYQQYEQLFRAVLLDSEIKISGADLKALEASRQRHLKSRSKDSLGKLVDVASKTIVRSKPLDDDEWLAPDEHLGFRMRMSSGLSPESAADVRKQLKRLVASRNKLCHHFLQEFDLGTEDGRSRALKHLNECREEVTHAMANLKALAATVMRAREVLSQLLADPEFERFLIDELSGTDGSSPET